MIEKIDTWKPLELTNSYLWR